MNTTPDEEELLDIVDGNQKVVGSITHAEAYDVGNLHGNYLRASNGFIINSRGELWIPKRTAHKKIAPNGLDYSVGEHVQAGESYIHAAIRGFAEELNIVTAENDLVSIGMAPPIDVAPYFAACYMYFSDLAPSYNHDDYVGYEWLKPDALLEKLRSGIVAKPSLAQGTMLVLAYLDKHPADK